ncbi:hotdog fold thioesterase [Nocardia sp. SYP-A9097]|uniref:PaaI family thioesterase n=1 Tax=Nocardia sp. SYP-A9097 TaxID=2663237 RepID=UPI00129A94B6|nr:PaaI family thioesterase [Nocardia sp. SYP-A9097]MRH89400.1 hotdog fold thioesterase [Nocardia sp. SYP-A9097]
MNEEPAPASRQTPTGSGPALAEALTSMLEGRLPGNLGMTVLHATSEKVVGELRVHEGLLAPNGYLHAASVVALADTMCGIGTRLAMSEDTTGFTTAELKTNYLGTARSGVITATATPVHIGRRTQVWDATVCADNGRSIALFRCTQLMFQQ